MPLFGRGGDEVKQADGADPGAALTDALERYRAMPVPERAALVLATVAPAIAESLEQYGWNGVGHPKASEGYLTGLFYPNVGIRYDRLSAEQHHARHDFEVTLSEAFHALVLARLLIPYYYQHDVPLYSVSPEGLAALERGDVAEVVARRLPA